MAHPLTRIPFLGQLVDERFLEHRRRASSFAGFFTVFLALGLFEYRLFVDHVWSWDLMSLALAFAIVKMSMFAWYRFND